MKGARKNKVCMLATIAFLTAIVIGLGTALLFVLKDQPQPQESKTVTVGHEDLRFTRTDNDGKGDAVNFEDLDLPECHDDDIEPEECNDVDPKNCPDNHQFWFSLGHVQYYVHNQKVILFFFSSPLNSNNWIQIGKWLRQETSWLTSSLINFKFILFG